MQDLESEKARYLSACIPVIAAKKKRIFTKLPPPPPPQPRISLASEVGTDYSQLRDYLAAKNWKEADRETTDLMLQVGSGNHQGWFDKESIDKFPSTDLQTIDRLGFTYSRGKFGFSVQKRISQSTSAKNIFDAEAIRQLADRIGWRVGDRWLYYDDIIFSTEAPEGHLPLDFTSRWGSGFHIFCGWCVKTLTGLLSRNEL